MNQPIPNVKISLRNISTNWNIIKKEWSTTTADAGGNYDFTVLPGRYAVILESEGKDRRIDNITVYSDSVAGSLQSFMLTPTYDELTPFMVQECIASYEGATAAELRARQWAENPIDVPVIDMKTGYGPEYSAYHWAHKAGEIVNTDTNINFRDQWVSTAIYVFRDAVQYNGSCFYCHTNNTNIPPNPEADNQYWGRMALKGDKGDKGDDGSGTGDMSNYYTKAEVDNILNSYYTKQEIQVNYYNKAYIDSLVLGGGGSFVLGAIGTYALVGIITTGKILIGTLIPGSSMKFLSIKDTMDFPGPDLFLETESIKPAGTWVLVADEESSFNTYNSVVLACRVA